MAAVCCGCCVLVSELWLCCVLCVCGRGARLGEGGCSVVVVRCFLLGLRHHRSTTSAALSPPPCFVPATPAPTYHHTTLKTTSSSSPPSHITTPHKPTHNNKTQNKTPNTKPPTQKNPDKTHNTNSKQKDEIDAIGTKRYDSHSGGEREIQRTMLELLNQMDGFDAMSEVKVRVMGSFACCCC